VAKSGAKHTVHNVCVTQKSDEKTRKKKDRDLSTLPMERWPGGHHCDVHSDLSLRAGFSLNFSNGPKSVIFKACPFHGAPF
jgi:hypothetical protein